MGTPHLRVAALLLAVAAFAGAARTYSVPFHTVNGMILLDAVVDGTPASLLLDTGANNTIVSVQAGGLTMVQLRSLQATKAGTGAEGDYITRTNGPTTRPRNLWGSAVANAKFLIWRLAWYCDRREAMQIAFFSCQQLLISRLTR